jgi:glucose-6-phosphate-specific signal transduction histidine kinase
MNRRIDWSQVWYPGPTRVFTPDELARAGSDLPSPTLSAVALINVVLFGFMLMQAAPPQATASLTLVLALAAVLGWQGAQRLWRRPTRRALALWTVFGVLAVMLVGTAACAFHGLARGTPARAWVLATTGVLAMLLSIVWWFVTVWRAQQIEARLRELADQERALAMAGQLAAAQIQPHFLYNTLASLQHWVQAKDDRAAPLLAALTGFLRATLPLFNRPRLALGDEAAAVREYLEVMRLRLGERLGYRLRIDAAAATAQVPPGLLLTLVENAVEHGVTPSLRGAEIEVQATVADGMVTLEVRDTGPGLAPGAADGVGLSNTRSRLAQAFGGRARLSLENAEGGGCRARITFPLEAA